MKTLKVFLLLSFLSSSLLVLSQKNDTIKRIRNTSLIIGGGSIVSFTGLYQVWYKNYPSSKLHVFNDSKNWLQMDKLGHVYTANKLSHLFYNTYKRTGINNTKAALIGSSLGLGLQTTIEIMDGYSEGWGFSWSDMAANTIGSVGFLLQQLKWNENKFLLKFSYHNTKYAAVRPEVLGSNFSERFLKDYNGQTYWLSFSPNLLFKRVPKWACLSIGYSVDEKLVGNKEYYFDPLSNQEYFSSRQFFLSLDIDFSQLPIKREWLKRIVQQFNYLKVPFPTLMLNNNSASFKGIYF